MKRLARALTLLAATTVPALPAAAQQQPALRPASELEQRLVACLAELSDVATLRQNLGLYRSALGTRRGATVVVYLIDALGHCPPDGKPTLDEAHRTELLDRVSYHRRRGNPERMLPALAVLEALMPDDARVLYALGEAYGVQSAAFDPKKAEQAFARLYDVLLTKPDQPALPRAQARALIEFLPELGGGTDRSAWLRDRVRGFCETLRGGQAIGLWKLRDPRLEELQEDLRLALRRGVQREIADILQLMRDIHPDDPASCYMLAQVFASLGPAFDAERSVALLEEFLDLTAEERFAQQPDDDPLMSRDDIARRLLGMQVATAKDQLQELRIEAKETVLTLTSVKGKPEPMLFYPDADKLGQEIRSVGRKHETENRKLEKSQARIDKLKAELAGAEADYEAWKRGERRRGRGVRDPQSYVDAINSRKVSIERLEKKQAPLAEEVGALKGWLNACEARRAEFR